MIIPMLLAGVACPLIANVMLIVLNSDKLKKPPLVSQLYLVLVILWTICAFTAWQFSTADQLALAFAYAVALSLPAFGVVVRLRARESDGNFWKFELPFGLIVAGPAFLFSVLLMSLLPR